MSDKPLKCYLCDKDAVTYRSTDGRFLCSSCFSKWVVSTVSKTIRKKKLFKRDDRIIVGLSGGKDSVVMLDVLNKIEKKFPAELIAVCIDEGIDGYRDDGLPLARKNAKRLDIEFHLYSFKKLFGYTLDEMVNRSLELQEKLPSTRPNKLIQHAPCSFCGVFRRKALNYAARRLDGDKVATGHNLNDVSQTIVLNLLRGDTKKLIRGDIKPIKIHELFVPRVKPMQAVAERYIVLYAFYNNLDYHLTECPYAVEAMRLDVREFLTDIEEKYPGSLGAIRNSMQKVATICNKAKSPEKITNKPKINECAICSEAATGTICKGCEMLEALFKKKYE